MTDSPPPAVAGPAAPDRASVTVRAWRKSQRQIRTNRREACFELMSAGYSYAEIAKALKVGILAVRRDMARAIEQRRLDAPERYVHFQVDWLTRALRSADDLVERGDMKAVTPLIKLIGALDRYHGLDAPYAREPVFPPFAPAPRRLAIGVAAPKSCESIESDAQASEKAGL